MSKRAIARPGAPVARATGVSKICLNPTVPPVRIRSRTAQRAIDALPPIRASGTPRGRDQERAPHRRRQKTKIVPRDLAIGSVGGQAYDVTGRLRLGADSRSAATPLREATAEKHAVVIEISHLSKNFGARPALDDVSFRFEPGRVTAFLGPNGSARRRRCAFCSGLSARHPVMP